MLQLVDFGLFRSTISLTVTKPNSLFEATTKPRIIIRRQLPNQSTAFLIYQVDLSQSAANLRG